MATTQHAQYVPMVGHVVMHKQGAEGTVVHEYGFGSAYLISWHADEAGRELVPTVEDICSPDDFIRIG